MRVGPTAAATVALLAVFGALLASADAAFSRLLGTLVPQLSVPGVLRWAFLVAAAGALVLAASYLLLTRPAVDGPAPARAARGGLVEWAVPVGSLVGLFATFVGVQLTILFGGAPYVLRPDGPTYAEYARRGFWQLLVVTALTLLVVAVAATVAPRVTTAQRRWLRGLLGSLALLTLVIVASALFRMHTYQQAYGFTWLRVLVSVAELWLGLVFLLVLAAGVRLRAGWLPRAVVATGVAAVLALVALNPDRFIAEANLDRWAARHPLDAHYLGGLSADAVPALLHLPGAAAPPRAGAGQRRAGGSAGRLAQCQRRPRRRSRPAPAGRAAGWMRTATPDDRPSWSTCPGDPMSRGAQVWGGTVTGVSGTGSALALRGLTKRFGGTVAVAGIDLDVPVGSFFGLLGPNGAGKTTTLSMAVGLLRPDAGTAAVRGVDVWSNPAAAKRRLGALPDGIRLFDRLSGPELLAYTGLLRGMDRATVDRRAAELLDVLALTDAGRTLVVDYSAGMKKKIGLACALLHAPRLLVLDEPFEAVDPVSAALIRDILTRYVAGGGTVIFSSHVMAVVERLCTHVAVLASGTIRAVGELAEVRGGRTLEEAFVALVGGRTATGEELSWL